MGFIWELLQENRIHQADQSAWRAHVSAQEAQGDIQGLEQKVRWLEERTERLTLAVMAMAEILRDQGGITEEAIEAKIREIDLRDGKPDGKLPARVKRCGQCNRVSSPTRAACLYCGTPLPEESLLFPS